MAPAATINVRVTDGALPPATSAPRPSSSTSPSSVRRVSASGRRSPHGATRPLAASLYVDERASLLGAGLRDAEPRHRARRRRRDDRHLQPVGRPRRRRHARRVRRERRDRQRAPPDAAGAAADPRHPQLPPVQPALAAPDPRPERERRVRGGPDRHHDRPEPGLLDLLPDVDDHARRRRPTSTRSSRCTSSPTR